MPIQDVRVLEALQLHKASADTQTKLIELLINVDDMERI